ncbi:sensor histidine kinase [Arcicella rosea]|uniref:Sensor histidine kinase YesM n=1 Tax=Arcicella rosea TaxID=502909 RepID=A0A841EGU5_9BACT|nr:histidine kinase [Arcicella rosea]MBB6001514.1 sensor histidine kinase YesM [Arcicella rosea]
MEKITDLFLRVYPIEGVSSQRRVLLHIVFWVLLYLSFWVILVLPTASLGYKFISVTYISTLNMILFYSIIYLILPSWGSNGIKKYVITFLGTVTILLIMAVLSYLRVKIVVENKWLIYQLSSDKYWKHYYNEGVWYFFKTRDMIGYTLEIFLTALPAFFIKLTRSLAKSVSEKKQIEIDYLRTQINPHFLTNTLNNIYSLTITEDKRNGDAILSLSSLLDYVLYESNQHTISLEREVNFLANFIALEKIRNTKRLEVSFDIEGEIKGNIPPMILITFVENAFKHSIGDLNSKCYIKILLKVDNNNLVFEVVNSKSDTSATNRKKTFGGIGLNNVKKRLSTLYPNKHELEIHNQAETYIIQLKLPLS